MIDWKKSNSAEFRADEQGQNLVEFALTIGIVLIILLAILDLGRAVFFNTMLSAAAQAGARSGSITTNFSTIEESVQQRLSGIDVDDVVINVVRTDDYTEIDISYVFSPVTPFLNTVLPSENLQLTQTARMRQLGVSFPANNIAGGLSSP